MSNIKIGQISVTLHELPGPAVCDIGYGHRFFMELTKIREALVAAHDVLTERMRSGHATTPAEVHLASKLIELEVSPDWNGTQALRQMAASGDPS